MGGEGWGGGRRGCSPCCLELAAVLDYGQHSQRHPCLPARRLCARATGSFWTSSTWRLPTCWRRSTGVRRWCGGGGQGLRAGAGAQGAGDLPAAGSRAVHMCMTYRNRWVALMVPPPLQAAGRQPRAVRARAAGGGAPPPPLHAVCHPKPAGHLRWAQDAEPVCGWAGDSAPCLMFAPALAPAPELIEALARPAASCPTVDVVMLPLTGPSARASWSCTSRTSPTASSAPSWRRGAVGRGDALLSSVFSAFTPHQK